MDIEPHHDCQSLLYFEACSKHSMAQSPSQRLDASLRPLKCTCTQCFTLQDELNVQPHVWQQHMPGLHIQPGHAWLCNACAEMQMHGISTAWHNEHGAGHVLSVTSRLQHACFLLLRSCAGAKRSAMCEMANQHHNARLQVHQQTCGEAQHG